MGGGGGGRKLEEGRAPGGRKTLTRQPSVGSAAIGVFDQLRVSELPPGRVPSPRPSAAKHGAGGGDAAAAAGVASGEGGSGGGGGGAGRGGRPLQRRASWRAVAAAAGGLLMSPIAGGKRLLGAPAQSSAGSKGTADAARRGQQGATADKGIQSSPVVAGRVLSQQAPEAHAARAAVAIMQQSAARPAAATATATSRASGFARLPDAEDVPDAKDLEGDPLSF